MCTRHGLGSASPLVVLLSASEELRASEPTTYPLVRLLSIFSLLSITAFISDSPQLAIPCFALAPNCLMLAVASLPHGRETTLAGAATLSQALLIQPGRALEAELQVRSSIQRVLTATHVASCRTEVINSQDFWSGCHRCLDRFCQPQQGLPTHCHPKLLQQPFSCSPRECDGKQLEGCSQSLRLSSGARNDFGQGLHYRSQSIIDP
jgi:hypothetical protein